MNYPQREDLDDVLRGKQYVEDVNWKLFEYLDDDGESGRHVLIIMGDKYTVLDAQEYMQVTHRLLTQL